MNKETFLLVLREKLSILDENEINDIIQEYSNHIDERISHGDSEDDAVKAFGDVNALAAEILKGYKIADDHGKNDFFNNLSKIIGDLANSVVDFFENLTKNQSIDVRNTLASIIVAIILLFVLNIAVNIIYHIGLNIINIGNFWYTNDPFLIIWTVVINLLRALAIVIIIYTTYKNIINNKTSIFMNNKENNKKSVNNNLNKKTSSTKDTHKEDLKQDANLASVSSGAEKTILIIIKVFITLFSIPFYFIILGLLLVIALIVGLMIKGVFFWGVLLILIGLVFIISSILGMIFKLVGGLK